MGTQQTSTVLEAFQQRFGPKNVTENAFRDISDIVLFVHVPKTGGMSVGKSLQSAFDRFHGISWNKIRMSFKKRMQEACYIQTTNTVRQVIMGHYSFDEVVIWKSYGLPVKCATIIREPVARLVSQYNYNCSEVHPGHEQFKHDYPTLMSFAKTLQDDCQVSRLVGPSYSFDHILEKLTADYTFIGVTEHLAESLKHFERSHGLAEVQEHRINIGKLSKAHDGVPDDVRELVLRRSQNDVKLHKILLELYK